MISDTDSVPVKDHGGSEAHPSTTEQFHGVWNWRDALKMVVTGVGIGLVVSACFLTWRRARQPVVDAFGVKGTAFQIKEREIDRGKVRVGESVRCTFHLYNSTSESLHIQNVSTGCTCAMVNDFTKKVAPHSWGSVTVEIDTTRKAGHRSSSVHIETDDAKRPRINSMAKCTVLPSAETKPERLKFLPQTPTGEFQPKSIEVVGLLENEAIEIRDVQSDDPMISMTHVKRTERGLLSFDVMVDKAIPAGTTLALVTVNLDGSARESVRVPVTVVNELKIKSSPAILKMTVDNTALQTTQFTVRTIGQRPLEINRVTLPGRNLREEQRQISKHEIQVRLSDMKVTNDLNGKYVIVATNHGELRVPIIVGAQKQASLAN